MAFFKVLKIVLCLPEILWFMELGSIDIFISFVQKS